MKSILLFCILFFSHSLMAQTLVISDSLTNGKTVGEVYENDSIAKSVFSKKGYQPGAALNNQNHILYDVPYSFTEGYIEFEIRGMENPSIPNSEPAFCALYDGRNLPEPIVYATDYKQNFYRWNIQYRQDLQVFRSKIQMAPNTAIMDYRVKPVFTNKFTGSYADECECITEPDGKGMIWDKNKWYKIRIQWRNKKYSLTVDGQEMWATTLSCDYKPRDMRIWLGCAPGREDKYTATIPELTFRNFKLYAYDAPNFNYGEKSVNFVGNGYLFFPRLRDVRDMEKTIFLQNLSDSTMTISTKQNTQNFTISENTIVLQAHEKKEVLIKMDLESPDHKSTKFSFISPAFTRTYMIKCVSGE